MSEARKPESSSSRAAPEPDYNLGPNVDGRPLLTLGQVMAWCEEAHAPRLTENAAVDFLQAINLLLWRRVDWAPEAVGLWRDNASAQRCRRIAKHLALLEADLAALFHDTRQLRPTADLQLFEDLLERVCEHREIFRTFEAKEAHPQGRQKIVTQRLLKLLEDGFEQPDVRARDIIVSKAMKWLTGTEFKDSTIARNRRRTK